jgi:hypothetical protein
LFPGLVFLSVIIASFCCSGNNNHHSATSNPIPVVALFIKFGFDEAAVEHAKDQLEQQAAIKRKEEMRRAADAMLDGKESGLGALGGGIDDDSNNIFAPANGAGASLLPRRSNPLQSRYYRDYEDSLQDSGSAGRLSPVQPQQQDRGGGGGNHSQRPSAAAADPANPAMLMGVFPRRNLVSALDVPSSSEAERDNSPMIPLQGKDGKTVMVRASIPLEGKLDPALLRGLHGMNIASESEGYEFTDNEKSMSRQGSVQPMLFARAGSPENFSIALSSTAAAPPDSEIVDRRVLPPAAAGQKPVVIAAVKPGARRADAASSPDMRNRPQHHQDSLDDDDPDSGAEALNESSRRVFIHSASVKSTPKATNVTAPPTPATLGSSRSLKMGGHGGHAAPLPPVVAGAENDFMDDL